LVAKGGIEPPTRGFSVGGGRREESCKLVTTDLDHRIRHVSFLEKARKEQIRAQAAGVAAATALS
jgi:hypothetical protein